MRMKLTYRYNAEVICISETPNDADVEFEIKIVAENMLAAIKEVQKVFEENKVYTDVLFYPYEKLRYRVIVRQDYYVDFILSLLKRRLIDSAEWS